MNRKKKKKNNGITIVICFVPVEYLQYILMLFYIGNFYLFRFKSSV